MKGDHYLCVITIIDNYNFHHHTKGKLGSVPEELKSEYDNLFFSRELKRKRGNKSCHSWLKTKDYANETKNNRKYNKVISEYRHHLPSLFHLKYTHNFFQIYYVWLVVIYLHVFFFHLSIKDSTGGKSNELRCDKANTRTHLFFLWFRKSNLFQALLQFQPMLHIPKHISGHHDTIHELCKIFRNLKDAKLSKITI